MIPELIKLGIEKEINNFALAQKINSIIQHLSITPECTECRYRRTSNATPDYDEVKKIANNVLYFDDNNDYSTALWKILKIVAPEIFSDSDCPELNYIKRA